MRTSCRLRHGSDSIGDACPAGPVTTATPPGTVAVRRRIVPGRVPHEHELGLVDASSSFGNSGWPAVAESKSSARGTKSSWHPHVYRRKCGQRHLEFFE